jgi:hypothetical protein
MNVHVLALDGVFDTGLATVLDAFETANELADMSGLASPHFDVAIVGVRKAAKTSQGAHCSGCGCLPADCSRLGGRPRDRVQDARPAAGSSGETRRE